MEQVLVVGDTHGNMFLFRRDDFDRDYHNEIPARSGNLSHPVLYLHSEAVTHCPGPLHIILATNEHHWFAHEVMIFQYEEGV